MRWVFIKPRNHSPYYDPEIQEPLGLEYLSAARRSENDSVLLLDAILDQMEDRKVARRAAAFMPDVVGFSLTTGQDVSSLLDIHREFVQLPTSPPCRWLAGGNFITTETEKAARLLPSDFLLVRYEGEIALAGLAHRWRSEASAPPNLMPAESRVLTGTAVENLEELPFPERRFGDQLLASGKAFNLQGSRGCCGACRYCSSPGMMDNTQTRWRGRSIFHVADEIEFLAKRFGASAFNFIDEDFLGPNHAATGRAIAFASEMKSRKIQATFGIQVRPGSLGEEAIDHLSSAGLVYVFMGIESDSPEDFQRWGRPWTENPWFQVTHLRKQGVEVNAGVLLFHPHSTLEGIRRFATKLHEHKLLEYRSARNRLDAMPGSVLYKEAIRTGDLDSNLTGPQPLPFLNADVDRFYRDLLLVLDPLGPPSMHALCALPPLVSRRRSNTRWENEYRELKQISSSLDESVAESFFALLALHEKGGNSTELVSRLRIWNLHRALDGCRVLVEKGFAPSFDALRTAIQIDAGV